MPNQNPMTVTIKKSTLLTKLQANRDKHRADYDKAMKNWRHEIAEEAKKIVMEAEEGTLQGMNGDHRHRGADKSHPLSTAIFDEPASFLESYTTTIGMLEMCEDQTIVLGHVQFRCYVQDEWEWKRDWMFSNSKYLG